MRPRNSGYLFIAPYVVLFVVVGIYPVGYVIYLALTSLTGHFTGLNNFITAFNNPFFFPAVENILKFLGIWLTSLVVFVVGMSLILHSLNKRVSSAFRFVLYLPAALAGSGSVMLWLFMLQPGESPWNFVLSWLGYHSLGASLAPAHLPVIYALIAFWSGAGSWIVVMYGALATIPEEVLENAWLDGAGAWRTAVKIKLPLIKKWLAYITIGAFAAGSQLFAEPQLVSQASDGLVNPMWSPNQLAIFLSFHNDNFNEAAAISVDLLVVALICAAVLLLPTGLFDAGH